MSKSIEEIIKELDKMAQKHEICARQPALSPFAPKYLDTAQFLREAIAKLKTHPEAQPNEPLTLEELREMDGKPVWIKHLPYPAYSTWWIINWVAGECILASPRKVNRGYTVKSYGEYWLAYRRPPEDATT